MINTAAGRADVPPQTWTILSLLEWAEQYFRERSFDESRLNAELLLAHALGLPRLGLYLQFDRPLTGAELASFKALFVRRLTHEPVQYILGETEFMGLKLEVNPSVLIPRPETEELVEESVAWLKSSGRGEGKILDIGTGSGNIAVALGKFLPGASVTTLDASGGALDVARRNCARHSVHNVEFVHEDILAGGFGRGGFDAVVTNPPYVSAGEFDVLQSEVRDFEPRIATTDGGDGFRFVRAIAALAPALLAAGGGMFMEIGDGQADRAEVIARDAGLTAVGVKKDFSGVRRILRGFAAGGDPGT